MSDTSDPQRVKGTGETILLVEDEQAILNLTKQMLQKSGYHILAARSPAEAIRLAREHAGRIKLLITDVVMPEMNGRELTERVLHIIPHLRLLFMSGYTDEILISQALPENIHFIHKPFTHNELETTIRMVLDAPPHMHRQR